MEPNNNQQPIASPASAPEDTSSPVEASSPTPVTSSPPSPESSANVVKNQDQPQGKDKKKLVVVTFLILVILMILAVVGYYAYSTMMSGSTDETPEATISEIPTLSPEPTTGPNLIEDEQDLDEVVDEIDSATDEAKMESEVQGLKTDSSF